MPPDFDHHETARALIVKHGHRAWAIAQRYAGLHQDANEIELAEFWERVALAANAILSGHKPPPRE